MSNRESGEKQGFQHCETKRKFCHYWTQKLFCGFLLQETLKPAERWLCYYC